MALKFRSEKSIVIFKSWTSLDPNFIMLDYTLMPQNWKMLWMSWRLPAWISPPITLRFSWRKLQLLVLRKPKFFQRSERSKSFKSASLRDNQPLETGYRFDGFSDQQLSKISQIWLLCRPIPLKTFSNESAALKLVKQPSRSSKSSCKISKIWFDSKPASNLARPRKTVLKSGETSWFWPWFDWNFRTFDEALFAFFEICMANLKAADQVCQVFIEKRDDWTDLLFKAKEIYESRV